jgi:hypothetical protein
MSSFVYVLVFVACFTGRYGCVTTMSGQTFASRQECLEAAGVWQEYILRSANHAGYLFSES